MLRKAISRGSFGNACICRTRLINSENIFQQDITNCDPKTRLLRNKGMSMCPQRNLREDPGKRRQGGLRYLDSILAQAGITISVLNLDLDLKPSGR